MADALRKRWGEWAILEAHLPGEPAKAIGVVLRDDCDKLHVKLSAEWWQSCAEADSDIWELLAADLQQKATHYRASDLLDWLAQGSHAIRLSPVRTLGFLDAERDLNGLYDEFVGDKKSHGRRTVLSRIRSSKTLECPFLSRLLATMRPSVHWAATAALATAVLCFAALNDGKRTQQSPLHPYPLMSASMFGRFPRVFHGSAVPYSEFFTDLEIQAPPLVRTKPIRRRKTLKLNKFRPPRLQPILPSRQVVKELRPPHIAVEPQSANVQLVAIEPSPAPAYVPRRNRFLRSLGVLGLPFKVLFGRRKSA